jgi:hypothetical protein
MGRLKSEITQILLSVSRYLSVHPHELSGHSVEGFVLNLVLVIVLSRPSQWPRFLRRGSAAARLLGLRVRIAPRTWMSVSCECCGVEVCAPGRSLVQGSLTEGVCVLLSLIWKPKKWGDLGTRWGLRLGKKENCIFLSLGRNFGWHWAVWHTAQAMLVFLHAYGAHNAVYRSKDSSNRHCRFKWSVLLPIYGFRNPSGCSAIERIGSFLGVTVMTRDIERNLRKLRSCSHATG